MNLENKAKLLYQGRASIRIVTREGKVIYIDPYAGTGYDLEADLILITHEHFDHNEISKISSRSEDCKIITEKESIVNGEYQSFDLGFVKIEAVAAGYNKFHNEEECVGYIIMLSDGICIYVTGDTAKTPQMHLLANKDIDYAFFCCDGVYTMKMEDAVEVANLIHAKHSIPYHMIADDLEFSREVAEKFNAENRLIIENGEEIVLE